MLTPQQRGRDTENLALEHLQSAGLELVARNFRCRWGELDLIVWDGPILVFVEVRYRQDARFGGAAESVNVHKQRKLIKAAQLFLQQHPQWLDKSARFDIVAIEEPARIEWIKNAFEA